MGSDLCEQFSMMVLPLSCLLCFISTFTFVAPFKLKTGEIWLMKSENDEFLLNVNSTPTELDTWYMLIKENTNSVSDKILTIDADGKLKKTLKIDDSNEEVFTDVDGSSSVTISYDKKTKKYKIDGILNNTWVIAPVDNTWIAPQSQMIWSTAKDCDDCLAVDLHTLKEIETETVGSDFLEYPSNETNLADDPRVKAQPLPSTVYPRFWSVSTTASTRRLEAVSLGPGNMSRNISTASTPCTPSCTVLVSSWSWQVWWSEHLQHRCPFFIEVEDTQQLLREVLLLTAWHVITTTKLGCPNMTWLWL